MTVFLLTDPITRPPWRLIKSSASSLSKLQPHSKSSRGLYIESSPWGWDENGEERKRNRKGRRYESNEEVDIRCPKFTLGLVLDDLKIDVTK
ncbi:hypothetical protein TIFTF001_048839 [Ficus carica]|uniref:Uncharacterized protein n=1 Tax=Ficus carica TaxID=3494 RepID=A0AA88CLG5_FICCA|nr:hypothetical protein TIFTF001_048839 [Ficus carica]